MSYVASQMSLGHTFVIYGAVSAISTSGAIYGLVHWVTGFGVRIIRGGVFVVRVGRVIGPDIRCLGHMRLGQPPRYVTGRP